MAISIRKPLEPRPQPTTPTQNTIIDPIHTPPPFETTLPPTNLTLPLADNRVEKPNGYKGTPITTEDLIEDKDGIFSYHYTLAYEIKNQLYKHISEDPEITSRLNKTKGKQNPEIDKTRLLLKRKINTFLSNQYKTGVKRIKNQPIMVEILVNELCGYGPIQPLYEDPTLSEIMLNTPYEAFIEYKGKLTKVKGCRFSSRAHLTETIREIASTVGRPFNDSNPIQSFMLEDLSRVEACHHIIAPLGPTLSIRKHMRDNYTVKDLLDFGSISPEMLQDLALYLRAGMSMATMGSTSSGKTTLLTSLMKLLPEEKRILTIEDTLELELSQPNVVVLQTRSSDKRPVRQTDLIASSLRQRPDIILIGEVRTADPLLSTLEATATGHQTLWSFHSSTPKHMASRCVVMLSSSGTMTERAAALSLASSLNILIIQKKFHETGERKITGIYELLTELKEEGGVSQVDFRQLWGYEVDGVVKDHTGTERLNGRFIKYNEISQDLQDRFYMDKIVRPSLEDCIRWGTANTKTTYERFEHEGGGWNG